MDSVPATVQPAPETAELTSALDMLASLRRLELEKKSALLGLQREWEDRNRVLRLAAKEVSQERERAEVRVRELGVAAWRLSGERQPAPGLEIKFVHEVKYDEAVALEWAREAGVAVTLNVRAFEKIALATPLPFVRIDDKVPKATIATDLEALGYGTRG